MLCVLLASCVCGATVATAQSKSAAGGTRSARLYFLRQSGLFGNAVADTRIQVNGQTVGIVQPGSYIFIDRPPGRYMLHVEPKILLMPNSYETEVTVAAGQVYYFEIGPRTSPTGAGVMLPIIAGNVGRRMDGQSTFGGSSYQFNSLDTGTGAAEVRKLKPMKR
jgi:hypothetical protein